MASKDGVVHNVEGLVYLWFRGDMNGGGGDPLGHVCTH